MILLKALRLSCKNPARGEAFQRYPSGKTLNLMPVFAGMTSELTAMVSLNQGRASFWRYQ
jgi:hypothetical protein